MSGVTLPAPIQQPIDRAFRKARSFFSPGFGKITESELNAVFSAAKTGLGDDSYRDATIALMQEKLGLDVRDGQVFYRNVSKHPNAQSYARTLAAELMAHEFYPG